MKELQFVIRPGAHRFEASCVDYDYSCSDPDALSLIRRIVLDWEVWIEMQKGGAPEHRDERHAAQLRLAFYGGLRLMQTRDVDNCLRLVFAIS